MGVEGTTCFPFSQTSTSPSEGFDDHLTWKRKSFHSPGRRRPSSKFCSSGAEGSPPRTRNSSGQSGPSPSPPPSSKATGGPPSPEERACHCVMMFHVFSGFRSKTSAKYVDQLHHDSSPSSSRMGWRSSQRSPLALIGSSPG